MLFGTITIWTALAALLISCGCYLAAARQRDTTGAARLTRSGRYAFALAAVSVLAAAATLGVLLVTHRFDVAYVYEHSARAMAPLYWFPSFWAGQEGSFLLWAFWTSILGLVLAWTSGGAERRVMPVYNVILLFLVVMLLVRSPFAPLDTQGAPVPTEGLGLNPLLENPWMVIHPPTLFLGFSSLAVPFAFALAALFWRDWDGWLRRALPWGLFGFAALGLAMMMGGYWAYETLGWGGFWGWDPVENGPFVPWMCLVAFLHAAQIQRVRGGWDRPTLFFAMLPFGGAMYESFLTRSGVLKDFSVHSFSELGGIANSLLLWGLLLAVFAAVGALLWRQTAIRRGESTLDVPSSREFGFTLAVVVLTLCALIAGVGMSAPLLTGFAVKLHLMPHVATVKEDFYNRATFPIAFLLAVGLGLGPHLAWRGRGGMNVKVLTWSYPMAVVAAIGYVAVARLTHVAIAGPKLAALLLLFAASVFALFANLALLWPLVRRTVPPLPSMGEKPGVRAASGARSSAWTVGGTVSHIGAVVLLLGIVCLVTFVRKDEKVLLVKDRPWPNVLGGQYTMTYLGQTGDYQKDRDNFLRFRVVSRDGRENFEARLPFALRTVEGQARQVISHPAIVHHAGGDLYLALKDGPDEVYTHGRFPNNTIPLGTTKQVGQFTIQFVKFERDPQAAALAMSGQMPDVFPVWAVLRVTDKITGQTTLVRPEHLQYSMPYQRMNPTAPQYVEATLPGGWLISFDGMSAGSADTSNPNGGAMQEGGSFTVRPPGPVVEAFELEVTTRPMINLVWVGTLLLVAGGLISMRRRILENRAIPIPDLPEPTAPVSGPGGRAARRRARNRVAQPAPAPSLTAGRTGRGG